MRAKVAGVSGTLSKIDLCPSSLTSTSTSAAKAWGSHLHRVPPHTDKRHTPQRCASVLQSPDAPHSQIRDLFHSVFKAGRAHTGGGTRACRRVGNDAQRCIATARGTSFRRSPILVAGVVHWSRSANVTRRLSSPPSFHLSLHTRGQGCDQPLRIEHENLTFSAIEEQRTSAPRVVNPIAPVINIDACRWSGNQAVKYKNESARIQIGSIDNSANGVSKITRRGAPWRSAARGVRVVRPDGGKDNRSRGEGCVNLGLARRTLCIVHQSLAHAPSSRSTNMFALLRGFWRDKLACAVRVLPSTDVE
jgi:hypothetical protein